MTSTRMFIMRAKTFRAAMQLWDGFAREDPTRSFNHHDIVLLTGKHLGGGLRALRECGVLEIVGGLQRSRARRLCEAPTRWQFTPMFVRYMGTPAGQEELEAARAYRTKQQQSEGATA